MFGPLQSDRPVDPRFGIALQTDKTPAAYIELAERIDRYDFGVVSVYNDLTFHPAIGPLLLMAPHIHRARLGPAVLNPFTLHPIEIAGQIALLDAATGGRAYLGLGRGAWLDAIGREPSRPLGALREAIGLVRHLWRGEAGGFAGRVFRAAPEVTLRYPAPRTHVPVLIGTWGTATARLAGEIADEVKIGGSVSGAIVRHLRPHVDAGSARAIRASGAVGICLGGVTVVDRDRAAARALARREVAPYVAVVGALDPGLADRAWIVRVEEALRSGDLSSAAAAIPESVLDRFALAGTPEDIVRRVEDAFAAGASRLEFGTPHGRDEAEGIALLGERVLPAFRR